MHDPPGIVASRTEFGPALSIPEYDAVQWLVAGGGTGHSPSEPARDNGPSAAAASQSNRVRQSCSPAGNPRGRLEMRSA